jgi:valyl-tRNA synthetase
MLQSVVAEIRRIRSDNEIPNRADVGLFVPDTLRTLADACGPLLASMCRVDRVMPLSDRGAGALNFTIDGVEFAVDPSGAVDPAAERTRLESRLADLNKRIGGLEGRLSNASYVEKAPPRLVDETRQQLATAQADRDATAAAIEAIT